MPLTSKGEAILANLEHEYGSASKAKQILYAGKNAGTFSRIDAGTGTICNMVASGMRLRRRIDAWLDRQDEFREADHPRAKDGKFGNAGGGGSHSSGGAGGKTKTSPAAAKAKVAGWLKRDNVSAALSSVARSAKTTVIDREKVKGAIGGALNLAIGHYVYTHDYMDSDVVSHAVQHIEVGLAVTAAQAKDVLRGAVDALLKLRGKARADAVDDDDEFFEALQALRKALG